MFIAMKTNLTRCLIAALSAFALVDSHAGNLLTNGSFELPGTNGTVLGYAYYPGGSTALPGWTTLLSGVEYGDPSQSDGVIPIYLGVAQDGSQYVDLAPVTFTGGGGIQQTFSTVPGQNYEVSFYSHEPFTSFQNEQNTSRTGPAFLLAVSQL